MRWDVTGRAGLQFKATSALGEALQLLHLVTLQGKLSMVQLQLLSGATPDLLAPELCSRGLLTPVDWLRILLPHNCGSTAMS